MEPQDFISPEQIHRLGVSPFVLIFLLTCPKVYQFIDNSIERRNTMLFWSIFYTAIWCLLAYLGVIGFLYLARFMLDPEGWVDGEVDPPQILAPYIWQLGIGCFLGIWVATSLPMHQWGSTLAIAVTCLVMIHLTTLFQALRQHRYMRRRGLKHADFKYVGLDKIWESRSHG